MVTRAKEPIRSVTAVGEPFVFAPRPTARCSSRPRRIGSSGTLERLLGWVGRMGPAAVSEGFGWLSHQFGRVESSSTAARRLTVDTRAAPPTSSRWIVLRGNLREISELLLRHAELHSPVAESGNLSLRAPGSSTGGWRAGPRPSAPANRGALSRDGELSSVKALLLRGSALLAERLVLPFQRMPEPAAAPSEQWTFSET